MEIMDGEGGPDAPVNASLTPVFIVDSGRSQPWQLSPSFHGMVHAHTKLPCINTFVAPELLVDVTENNFPRASWGHSCMVIIEGAST